MYAPATAISQIQKDIANNAGNNIIRALREFGCNMDVQDWMRLTLKLRSPIAPMPLPPKATMKDAHLLTYLHDRDR